MRVFVGALCGLAFCSGTALAASSPVHIVERHVAAMKKGELRPILSDYAPTAVVISPPGLVAGEPATERNIFVGASRVRKVFATLTDKDHHPGIVTMQTSVSVAGPGVARLRWVQFKGTPQEVSGEDIFVVRGGKILYQAILVDPPR